MVAALKPRETTALMGPIAWGSTAVAFAALISVTVVFINRNREQLLHQVSKERSDQLGQITQQVEDDLHAVSGDLRFAAALLAESPADPDRRKVLAALLGGVTAYRVAAVYSSTSNSLITVLDPRLTEPPTPALIRSAEVAATQRNNSEGTGIVVMPPFETDHERWFRVFTTLLPTTETGDAFQTLALVVDMQPLLSKLTLAAVDTQSELLVLGPHGHAAPASHPRLAAAVVGIRESTDTTSGFRDVVARMLDGARGSVVLPANEAHNLGFMAADMIVAFAPIRGQEGLHWSAATFTSMATLRTHEEGIIRRVAVLALLVALGIAGVAGYVVRTSRRAAILEERVRHATELAALHERADKLLETIPTLVLGLSEHAVVQSLNQAVKARSPNARVGDSLDQALPSASPDVVKTLRVLAGSALAANENRSIAATRTDLFGNDGYFNIYAIPLSSPVDNVQVVLAIEDVSAVHRLEDQLLRTEKLATVGTLAAGIAHEIGTPLGVIRGRAEYILSKLDVGQTHEEGLGIIIEQIDRITRTIRALLDFSRTRPLVVGPVDVGALLQKVAELLQYEFDRRQVHLAIDIPTRVGSAAADADQMEQVFVNLMMNALDACAHGGHVSVSVAETTRPRDTTERALRIQVADDGIGIVPEDRHKIFDPFFTTKKRGQNTGLGLTMVAQIVRSHGAEIQVATQDDKGTRFVMLWPMATVRAEVSSVD